MPKFTCLEMSVQVINLAYNALSNNIPDFGRLTNLVSLDLSHNNFQGNVPGSFGQLTQVSLCPRVRFLWACMCEDIRN